MTTMTRDHRQSGTSYHERKITEAVDDDDNSNDNDEKAVGADHIALHRAAHIGDASSSTTNDGYHILGR